MSRLDTKGALQRLGAAVWNSISWTVQSWRTLLVCLVVGDVLLIADHEAAGVAVLWLVPLWSTARAAWDALNPLTYERFLGGPLRRRSWVRRVRHKWATVARNCGLAWPWDGSEDQSVPRLLRVSAHGNSLTLRLRAVVGQTVDDLAKATEAIATAFDAEAGECHRVSPGVVELVLTMRELLHEPTTAAMPSALETEAVTVGRRADGTPWRLDLAGRHTLVVGRSGSGKGSVFWGIAGNLAPSSHVGLVRLWGIDLKGGVEVAVGAPMFASVAIDEQEALALLRDLSAVIAERQTAMRGHSRLFVPAAGDPVHVLLIDELAVLTGYASHDVINEAGSLLKRILTQGRALGVMVVAFVQDPRKETVGMRELFTQTIALRLASTSETRMVLGDGYGVLAPAHRIDRTMPGAGYVVSDDGVVERVRADFWPDDLIRTVAATYPAPAAHAPEEVEPTLGELVSMPTAVVDDDAPARRRTPRVRTSVPPEDPEEP